MAASGMQQPRCTLPRPAAWNLPPPPVPCPLPSARYPKPPWPHLLDDLADVVIAPRALRLVRSQVRTHKRDARRGHAHADADAALVQAHSPDAGGLKARPHAGRRQGRAACGRPVRAVLQVMPCVLAASKRGRMHSPREPCACPAALCDEGNHVHARKQQHARLEHVARRNQPVARPQCGADV